MMIMMEKDTKTVTLNKSGCDEGKGDGKVETGHGPGN